MDLSLRSLSSIQRELEDLYYRAGLSSKQMVRRRESHGPIQKPHELSQRAKAFSIDSLLNTERRETCVKDKPNTSGKVQLDVETCKKTSFGQQPLGDKYTTPDKKETLPKHENNFVSGYYENISSLSEYRLALQGSYYSPLMTCGYIRPIESYSPMSNEGQNTPLGLRSVFPAFEPTAFSTPNPKSSSSASSTYGSESSISYSTPSDLARSGSRKILTSHGRSHNRSHPYASPRQHDSTCGNSVEVICKPREEKTSFKQGRTKRFRTAFTAEQLDVLEREFEKQQYCVGDERVQLADSLNLSVSQVKVWFQNRRIRWRKEQFGQ